LIGYILEIDPGLDLSTLDQVRASRDYRSLLVQISTETGKTFTATERESGVGVAMLVPVGDKNILAIDLAMLECLFHEDKSIMLTSVNMIHHELAHAHDSAVKHRNLPDVWMKRQLEGWSSWTSRITQSIWDEYFAERRSFPTLPNGESLRIPLLEIEIPRIAETIQCSIEAFRVHLDIERLVREVFAEVSFLFQLTGYALGTLAASGQTIEDTHAGAANAVHKSSLGKRWDALATSLDIMWTSHGEWPGFEIFEPLERVVHETIGDYGVILLTRPDGSLYADVPFPTSTMS